MSLVLMRLDYGNATLASIPLLSAQATSVSDELCCLTGVLIIAV